MSTSSAIRMSLLSTAALILITACGESTTPEQTAPETERTTLLASPISTAPLEAEDTVPTPTVTPNADPIETYHPNAIQPETTLNLTATADVKRAPDIAFLNAGVQTEGETAAAAMQSNAEAMNGVFEALKKANVATRDMQTSNFSLQPKYDYSSRKNGEPARLIGYTVSNQLTVKVRDLEQLGDTMDALVSAGGNTFSGLRFALEEARPARDEARRLAMADAIARAELYASASGYEVARIVTLSEGGGSYGPQPVAMMARSMDMAEATPIASGEVGYTATVNVQFELRRPAEE